jgi:hypothetical protein
LAHYLIDGGIQGPVPFSVFIFNLKLHRLTLVIGHVSDQQIIGFELNTTGFFVRTATYHAAVIVDWYFVQIYLVDVEDLI